MKLTHEELERFRDIPIHTILNVHNNGRDIKLRCPFHSERTPSFTLYEDNHYHCFGCGKHGFGAIDFCKDLGLSFKESLEELCTYI